MMVWRKSRPDPPVFRRKFETAEAVEAGEVCAVTGLTTTVPGQGLGAQQESSVPVLEPVLNYRIYLPDEVNAVEMMEN